VITSFTPQILTQRYFSGIIKFKNHSSVQRLILSMARFKCYLEYDGTKYSGWQQQKHARTVQGELITAIRKSLHTETFDFQGSGRTDAGVHALCQVAHLDVKTMLTPNILRLKLNDLLPADIHLLHVEKTHDRFHARHHTVARSYIYQISRRRTAFGKKYVWWIKDPLDLAAMQRTAALFIGMKNFESFTADDPDEKSMKVLLEAIDVKAAGDLILIRFYGSHFLWKMVRQCVGVIAEVGRGKMKIQDVETFFSTVSSRPAELTAPPSGLFFERAYYDGDAKPTELMPALFSAFSEKN
jgi:tRNA pseudouridine38-40 synthase